MSILDGIKLGIGILLANIAFNLMVILATRLFGSF